MPVGFPDYYGGLTLPVTVAEGGTGQTSVTSKALLYGAGTSGLIATNVGTANQILQINSVTLDPTFQDLTVDVSVITGILPIANGGTGTATPALTAGTNIAITGTWPANTIALDVTGDLLLARTDQATGYITRPNTAGYKKMAFAVTGGGALDELDIIANLVTLSTPLGTGYGGTGTATPALTAGTGISITGTWPNNTITNSSNYAALADPLPVAHGGTGTATPALTAGTNISITGTWPDNSIAVVNAPVFSGNVTTDGIFIVKNDSFPQLALQNSGGTAHWALYENTSDGTHQQLNITNSVASTNPLSISTGDVVTLSQPLPTGSGGTGATSLAAAGIPVIVAKDDKTGQTSSIGSTTLLTPGAAGMYRVSMEVYVHTPTGTSSVLGYINWTQNGVVIGPHQMVSASATTSNAVDEQTLVLYCDASTNITYQTTWTSGGSGDSYDIHVRLEKI